MKLWQVREIKLYYVVCVSSSPCRSSSLSYNVVEDSFFPAINNFFHRRHEHNIRTQHNAHTHTHARAREALNNIKTTKNIFVSESDRSWNEITHTYISPVQHCNIVAYKRRNDVYVRGRFLHVFCTTSAFTATYATQHTELYFFCTLPWKPQFLTKFNSVKSRNRIRPVFH